LTFPHSHSGAQAIADAIPSLKKQLNDLTTQFHGFATPTSSSTLTEPNDPALAEDFAHATTLPSGSTSLKKSLRTNPAIASPKTVRFSDTPSDPLNGNDDDIEAQLFNGRYRDDPTDSAGYRDAAEDMDNTQIHAYHNRILEEQDEQLDRLGETIGRQRELSMQIGDELDNQVAMLDQVDETTDRHQGRLDRARRQLGRIARSGSDSKQMMTIVILIIILVLLIAILK
jgi:syntaxin 8